MSITFTCANPKCRARMTVPDNMAGKRGKCSKCKEPVSVPTPNSNGDNNPVAKHPVTTGGARTTPSTPGPAPRPSTVPPLPPPAAPPEPIDLEAAALSALADEPKEEEKPAEFVEFLCPQCDEPVKLSIDLAGKRHPCPHCTKIIAVPVPETKKPKDWRDTGPKLPAGARRPDEPAPEGAWGSTQAKGASVEALKEAGVIKEKEKPKTLAQKLRPYMLVGTPVLVLLIGGMVAWNLWAANQEKRAFDYAMNVADSKGVKLLGPDGLMALHINAGEYFLRSDEQDCAKRAREQYGKAVSLATSARSPASNALLGELAVAVLALADPEKTDTGRGLEWSETQKLVRATTDKIVSPPARLDALRRVTAGLVKHGQKVRVLSVVSQLYTAPGADRSEAFAVAGLELHRLGHKDEAKKALTEALAPYAEKKEPPEKKKKSVDNKPPLRAAVVALAVVMGAPPPKKGKSLDDDEAAAAGSADGNARLGKLDEARKAIGDAPQGGGSQVRALIALASAAAATNQKDVDNLITEAVEAVKTARNRRDLDWPQLFLIEEGLRAGVPAEKLEHVVASIVDRELAAWGRLLLLRDRLKKSDSVVPADSVEAIPARSLAGMVARLELARHNTYHDRGWANTIKDWDEGPQALGSLGVALGMQGEK